LLNQLSCGYWQQSSLIVKMDPWLPAACACLIHLPACLHICFVCLQYGDQDIQLSAAEQLVDKSQTRAVADALKWLQAQLQRQQQQGGKTLLQWLNELDAAIDQQVMWTALQQQQLQQLQALDNFR
jgi:hypothetical protein